MSVPNNSGNTIGISLSARLTGWVIDRGIESVRRSAPSLANEVAGLMVLATIDLYTQNEVFDRAETLSGLVTAAVAAGLASGVITDHDLTAA